MADHINEIDTEDFKITSFKVEQKIIDSTNSNSLNIGGFANGSSSISKFSTRYLVVMYSNKFKNINQGNGKMIRKRYGYGVGFTLNITDIQTKISFDYAVMAASAALNFANIGYEVNIYGVEDADLIRQMPSKNGSFNKEVYEKLSSFIDIVKANLASLKVNKLYPIEMSIPDPLSQETLDSESIYFGAKKVSEEKNLEQAIRDARNRDHELNENVIQFMYAYFGLKNAYSPPNNAQAQEARNWMNGSFNKIKELNHTDSSWVEIDPEIDPETGAFISLSHLSNPDEYKPHPLPSNWANIAKQIDIISSEVSMDFSSSLKVASMIDVSGKFNTVTFTKSVAMFADISDNAPEGSKVIETRYGVGVRLKMHVSKIEFGTDVTYANIGAVSELGHADIEFEISGYGITDKSILEDLPKPQTITQETMRTIDDAFTKIKDKLSNLDVSDLEPQPYQIRVSEPDKVDPTVNAQSEVFAIRKVAEVRAKLKDVLKEGRQLGLSETIIRKTYEDEFDITDEHKKPTASDRRDARTWLLWR